MKDPNGFDELARRKLAERDHAFDPSHWADMERLLAGRERKPKAWWPWMAAGMLLLGGAALWYVTSEEAVTMPASSGPVAERIEQPTTITSPAATVEVPTPTEGSRTLTGEPEEHKASPATGTGAPEVKAPRKSTAMSQSRGPAKAKTARSAAKAAHDDKAAASPTKTADAGTNPPMATTLTGSTLVADAPPQRTTTESHGTSGSMIDPAPSPVPTAPPSDAIGRTGTAVAEPVVPATDPSQQAAVVLVQEPPESAAPTPSGPSTGATDPSASGTETSAPSVEPGAAPPASPAWLAVRTPFELCVLGGAFSTTSDYRGHGTENWKASTERRNTAGFGIEGIWNIGDHFGLGFGAHYNSYRERLQTEELGRTDQTLTNNYFWMPHDTLVLTVVDTVTLGATDFYVTELVPMTVNVLGHSTDTTYHTTVVRQRRTVTNTVNYVEIPLLLDAHTSCGRWVFGVRGGPTFGLLTSKQGSIPGEGETGYADLNERAFSSMTLGCTARAYARYRLSSAWAIGVEPTWRQQLGNAFGDGDVQRRGTALGGYLSLSYRIAAKSVVP